jgi:DNA primase large subunit
VDSGMQFNRNDEQSAGGAYTRGIVGKKKILSLYRAPPTTEITLDEFEDFALERLCLLRGIEQEKTRGFTGSELNERITKLQNKHMPLKAPVTKGEGGNEEFFRKDVVSHFILRLAYCRTEELRRWFLEQECNLLSFRIDKYLSSEERASFMAEQNMDYEEATANEKIDRRDKLVGLCDVSSDDFANQKYFKVPFAKALKLVRHRDVYVEKGMAFVPVVHLVSIIVATFRANLSKALTEAHHMFETTVGTDTRIAPLLKNMNKQYTGKDFSKSEGGLEKLTADGVEHAAEYNMPLCMKNLHMALKRDKKLKHFGRLQYGLFLKGTGMEVDQSMRFWENWFGKIMGHDEFMKKYAYNIQHMYGKVGGRKSYTPYSCNKIIMGETPAAGQYHGCPYRHMGKDSLAKMLGGLKLGPKDVNKIVRETQDGHYQSACQSHFDAVHPGHQSMPEVGDGAYANHPNAWFNASVKYHRIKNGTLETPPTADENQKITDIQLTGSETIQDSESQMET